MLTGSHHIREGLPVIRPKLATVCRYKTQGYCSFAHSPLASFTPDPSWSLSFPEVKTFVSGAADTPVLLTALPSRGHTHRKFQHRETARVTRRE
jgi:hypothetical protein